MNTLLQANPPLGTLSQERYVQLCIDNGGEEGLWRLYAEEFKRQFRKTNSNERAANGAIIVMATKLGIHVDESQLIYIHLSSAYAAE